MASQWVQRINAELDRLHFFPTIEAMEITGAPDWVAWIDTQEVTVLDNPAAIARVLSALAADADIEEVWFAIHPYINDAAEEQIEWSDNIDGFHTV